MYYLRKKEEQQFEKDEVGVRNKHYQDVDLNHCFNYVLHHGNVTEEYFMTAY